MQKPNDIVITCGPAMAPWVAQELKALGLPVIKEDRLTVSTQGTWNDCMRLNLWLRTANKVLYKLKAFTAPDADALYDHVKAIPWEHYLFPRGYFSVQSSVKNDTIQDTRFPNLKVKDAVVDRMQAKTKRRPDSGGNRDASVIYLHWYNDQATIYIDTSGETIAKHGYRLNPWRAPLQENVAAACIMATQWQPPTAQNPVRVPFVNPMCGSGTLAIEAAQMALNTAPGLYRSNFGFMHWKLYQPSVWQNLRQEAKDKKTPRHIALPEIIATDIAPRAIEAAKENAEKAGVEKLIRFEVADYRDTPLPETPGVVVINPEYGFRMGNEEQLVDVYKEIGDYFKQQLAGYKGYVFTANAELAKHIGLRTHQRHTFYAGKMEARLLAYDLFEGGMKEQAEG